MEVRIDPRGLSVTYDREADEALLTDEDIIIRYRKGEVVGLAVLHFSGRIRAAKSLGRSGR